jgi:hypothetical protein
MEYLESDCCKNSQLAYFNQKEHIQTNLYRKYLTNLKLGPRIFKWGKLKKIQFQVRHVPCPVRYVVVPPLKKFPAHQHATVSRHVTLVKIRAVFDRSTGRPSRLHVYKEHACRPILLTYSHKLPLLLYSCSSPKTLTSIFSPLKLLLTFSFIFHPK